MPAPRTRRVRLPAAERRAGILDAAIVCFGNRGYHGASIDLIAQAAGVSKALIYEHFSSKRELHSVLLEEHVGELFGRLQANAAAGLSGRDRLRGGLDAFFGFVEDHREAFRVLFRDAADPEIAAALAGVQAQALSVMVALMEGDPETRDFPGRQQAFEMHAALLAGAVQSLANWWYHHQEVPRERLVDRTIEFAWEGLDRVRG